MSSADGKAFRQSSERSVSTLRVVPKGGVDPRAPYPGTPAFSNRGLEFPPEIVTFTGLRHVTVNFTASSPGDQLRVITEAVPEPGSLMLLGAGLAGLAARRVRRVS